MLNEFKKFALRGNVIDMAVGIVIGTAFTAIVNSLVKDMIMPPIAALTGDDRFTSWVWTLKPATETTEAITLNYGLFINTVIDFVLISFVIFLVVRQMNKLKKKEETKPATTPEDITLLREIRDALVHKKAKS